LADRLAEYLCTVRQAIQLTDHAVLRFHERVRPALTRGQARAELERLAPVVEIAEEPPAWYRGDGPRTQGYGLLGNDIAFPLMFNGRVYYAVTCVVRGAVGDDERRERNSKAQGARYRRRMHRKKWLEHKRTRRAAAGIT
jgi:hypothetical protein